MSQYNILDFFKHESIVKTGNILNAFLSNISIRIIQIKDYFNCGNPFGEIKGTYCNHIPFYMFSISFLITMGVMIFKRLKGNPNKKIEFLVAMSGLIFVQSIPSTSLGSFHNLIILPLLVTILCYGLTRTPGLLGLILAMVLIVLYINIDIHYYKI